MSKKLIFIFLAVILVVFVSLAFFFYFIKPKIKEGSFLFDRKGDSNIINNKCEQQYQKILSIFGQNFDDCRVQITKAVDCDKKSTESSSKQKNIVILFDSSGSMAEKIEDRRKIDIAKDSLFRFINSLDKGINLGLIVYGHKGSNRLSDKTISCQGIEEIYKIGPIELETIIKEKLEKFQPTGWTPIANSLEKAREVLEKYPAETNDNMIILISDGEETCGGDPVAKAKSLINSNLKIVTNVIGFDVSDKEEEKLKDIAVNGGGKYFSVDSQEELDNALRENENFMAGFECYMLQSDVWLGNKLDITFKQADCLHRLEMEERHNINLNTQLGNYGITDDCKDYILKRYQERYDKIKKEIEEAYKEASAESKQEEKKLEKIKESIDEEEPLF